MQIRVSHLDIGETLQNYTLPADAMIKYVHFGLQALAMAATVWLVVRGYMQSAPDIRQQGYTQPNQVT